MGQLTRSPWRSGLTCLAEGQLRKVGVGLVIQAQRDGSGVLSVQRKVDGRALLAGPKGLRLACSPGVSNITGVSNSSSPRWGVRMQHF